MSSSLPKPIRFDGDTWLCVRNDPALPKAIIRRYRDVKRGDVYLVVKWALDPAEQQLMSSASSLEAANALVRFDPPGGSAPAFAGYPHGTQGESLQPGAGDRTSTSEERVSEGLAARRPR